MDARRLARVHRVRSLQLGLARADEAEARDRLAGEDRLAARIDQLVGAIAPAPALADAAALIASAHFRERLHVSAAAAAGRRDAARHAADRAAEATRAARRDRSAIEKLIERADAEAAQAALRALRDGDAAAARTLQYRSR